ncbi:MAG: methyltransferase domain-containing protein [Acidobacteriota bacterium]
MEQQADISARQQWSNTSHERRVESFYAWGAERYFNFHDGYLNFGLWEDGMKDYVQAAENMVHRIATLVGVNKDSYVCDVACGMGTQDIYVMRNFSPKQIDAVDVTWPHIVHGRRRATQAGYNDRINFHHGTAANLPFPAETFTNVMSIEGPVHFDTREQFMREAYRVLKPGGTFALADYTMKRPPRNIFESFVIHSAARLWKVPQENRDTAERYCEKLKRSGFTDIELQEVGAQTIPGYYFEQRRPETIREISKIRGFVAGRLGIIIDVAVYQAFRFGLLEYILVRAKKR